MSTSGGVVVAVVHGSDADVAYDGYADVAAGTPMGPTTRFAVGCVGKLYTSALFRRLYDAGRCDLEAAAAAYVLPPSQAPLERTPSVRDLLLHRGGLSDYYPAVSGGVSLEQRRADYARRALLSAPLAEPGAEYSYSSAGYVVAGCVAERVGSFPWQEAVNRMVLGPLGLPRVGGRVDGSVARGYHRAVAQPHRLDRVAAASGGALLVTPLDLAKFALADATVAREERDVPIIDHGPATGARQFLAWTAFETAGGTIFSNGGVNGCHDSLVVAVPEWKFSVAASSNSFDLGVRLRRTVRRLMRERLGIEWPPRLQPTPVVDCEVEPAEYAGVYVQAAGGVIVVPTGDDALSIVRLPRKDLSPLVVRAHTPTLWGGPAGSPRPMVVRFHRNLDDEVDRIAVFGRLYLRATAPRSS